MTQADSSTESDKTPEPSTPANEPAPADAAGADSSELLQQIDNLQTQVQQEKDRYLRSVADLENFRRRVAREKDELRQYGISDFVQALLPALDNLKLGLQSVDAHAGAEGNQNLTEGFRLVGQQIQAVFADHGVEELHPEGEAFDPNLHDCVAHESSETVAEDTVIRVMRTGYRLNGRLLRPASVVVSSGAASASE
ncbi:MAG: nucleotide exchange factor GrpE [Opitutales bacterium]